MDISKGSAAVLPVVNGRRFIGQTLRAPVQQSQFHKAAMDGGGVDTATTAAWMEKHRQMYERATRHPFTVSIRDGTVDMSAFKRWLVSLRLSVPLFPPTTDAVMFSSCNTFNCRKLKWLSFDLFMSDSWFVGSGRRDLYINLNTTKKSWSCYQVNKN